MPRIVCFRSAIPRQWYLFLFSAVVLALLHTSAHSAGQEFKVSAPAGWVKPIDVAEYSEAAPDGVRNGLYFLLSDHQIRVAGRDKSQYIHYAKKIMNEQGLEDAASVEVVFDPSYETLTLHSINVHRDNKVISKIKPANVRIVQREKDLEYFIFDGRKSANIFLDDVRVGDTVEYSYTLQGVNPVFAGKHFGDFDLQWGVPIERVHMRLLWPAGRKLFVTSRNGAVDAKETELSGYRELTWNSGQVAGLQVDRDAPNWFDPYPQVQWGEYKDWESVVQWAVPMYRSPAKLSAEMASEIDRIAKTFAKPEERLAKTLRYVQKTVRYMGVEVGAGSHQPTDPNVVLARRFGDCKDKTLLTLTMLRALGIEAWAALVNTRTRRGVADSAPTPAAFNHVIVRARLPDREYWVDPTRSTQYGRLESISQPNFGFALVLASDTQGLHTMFPGDATKRRRKILSTLNVPADAKTRRGLRFRRRWMASPQRKFVVTCPSEVFQTLKRHI